LIFDLRRHHISVFIFQNQGAVGRALPGQGAYIDSGFNVATWSGKGLRYFVVGDVNREDVQALSALLQRG
jgi:anti-sigma factor RsiW